MDDREGAAEYIKASEGIVRQAVTNGDLAAHPIGRGRDYRVTAADVDEWMMSRSYEPKRFL